MDISLGNNRAECAERIMKSRCVIGNVDELEQVEEIKSGWRHDWDEYINMGNIWVYRERSKLISRTTSTNRTG